MALQNLQSAHITGKTVFLRVDVNVPITDKGTIGDTYRIEALLPSLHYILDQGCKVIIGSHLGRPTKYREDALSLRPVAEALAHMLGIKFVATDKRAPDYPVRHVVFFNGSLTEATTRKLLGEMSPKDIIFLENLRYYPGEEKNDPKFAETLASLADIYVNDAFAVSHRQAASIVGITKYLPSYCGIEFEQEVKNLRAVLHTPKHPFIVLMGGIKISDKEKTLQTLAEKADTVLLGGGLANLFFLSRGFEVGLSKLESDSVKLAFQMDKNYKQKFILPEDVVVANAHMDPSSIRVTPPFGVGKRELILDLGPKSILKFSKILKTAKTIVWNGPLGRFETKPFDTATMALAKIVGAVSKGKAFGVVGGGETVDAVRLAGQANFIDHVSTGGGAMLEFLADGTLPGILALESAK